MKKLIVKDSKKRLTTQQALQHPWVSGKAANFTHMDTAQKKLQEFNARRKLKVGHLWMFIVNTGNTINTANTVNTVNTVALCVSVVMLWSLQAAVKAVVASTRLGSASGHSNSDASKANPHPAKQQDAEDEQPEKDVHKLEDS